MNIWSNWNDSIIGSRKISVVAGSIEEVHLTISIDGKASGKYI